MMRVFDKMLYSSWLKQKLPPPFGVAAPLVRISLGSDPHPVTGEGGKAPVQSIQKNTRKGRK